VTDGVAPLALDDELLEALDELEDELPHALTTTTTTTASAARMTKRGLL